MILRTPHRRAQIFGAKLDMPKNAINVAIGGKADIRPLANKIEDNRHLFADREYEWLCYSAALSISDEVIK